MTAPRGTSTDEAIPTPWVLLLLPYAVILVAAALTPDSELLSNQGDLGLYLQKATELLAGGVPYRDFPLEYPPLALVPMTVPALLWPFSEVTLELYKWLFAGWEAALMLALGYVLTRIARLGGDGDAWSRWGAAARWTGGPADHLPERFIAVTLRLFLLTVGAALAIAFRFDLFPALLVAVAVWATLERRPAIAGVVIALGILAKLFPLAVVPALAVPWLLPLDVRRLARLAVAAAGTLALVMLPFLLLAGGSALEFLRYQAERGLQIESIGGGIAVLIGLVNAEPPTLSYGFSAVQVEGLFAAGWLAILPVITAAAFGLLGLIGWLRIRQEANAEGIHPGTVVALAGAAILVLLVTSKVFSIQYVAWIVPFAALLRGRQFWLALGVVALTMPIHPILYTDLVNQDALPILVLNVRNALVVALLGWVLWDLTRSAPRAMAAEPKAVASTARERT